MYHKSNNRCVNQKASISVCLILSNNFPPNFNRFTEHNRFDYRFLDCQLPQKICATLQVFATKGPIFANLLNILIIQIGENQCVLLLTVLYNNFKFSLNSVSRGFNYSSFSLVLLRVSRYFILVFLQGCFCLGPIMAS